jgi:hypothetical protein
MSSSLAPTRGSSWRWSAVLLLIVVAVVLVAFDLPMPFAKAARVVPPVQVVRAPDDERLSRTSAGPGEADGLLPGPISVFSDEYVGITRLDPDLLASLRRAALIAGDAGVTMYVDSGWRSRAYQQQLFDQAIAQYGSAEAAARWVARPGTSVHEAGDAVDIGRTDADDWLSRHGAHYGLCRMYGNEPWHFEWRPEAVDDGCPTPYADPTDDPRLAR